MSSLGHPSDTNAATMPPFLEIFSPELRLEIYKHLLAEFNGDPSHFRNLSLTCKQIKGEVVHELFNAFCRNWDTTCAKVQTDWVNLGYSPLRFTQSGSSLDQVECAVAIPMSYVRDQATRATRPWCWAILCPLLGFNLSKLSFSIYEDVPMLPASDCDWGIFRVFLHMIAAVYRKRVPNFPTNPHGFRRIKHDILVKSIAYDWTSLRTANSSNQIAQLVYGHLRENAKWEIKWDVGSRLMERPPLSYSTPLVRGTVVTRVVRDPPSFVPGLSHYQGGPS